MSLLEGILRVLSGEEKFEAATTASQVHLEQRERVVPEVKRRKVSVSRASRRLTHDAELTQKPLLVLGEIIALWVEPRWGRIPFISLCERSVHLDIAFVFRMGFPLQSLAIVKDSVCLVDRAEREQLVEQIFR